MNGPARVKLEKPEIGTASRILKQARVCMTFRYVHNVYGALRLYSLPYEVCSTNLRGTVTGKSALAA